MTVSVERYDFASGRAEIASKERAGRMTDDTDGFYWIDLESPVPEEISWLAGIIGLSMGDIAAARSASASGQFLWNKQAAMSTLIPARLAGDRIVTGRLFVAFSARCLVTLRDGPTAELEFLHREWRAGLIPRDTPAAHCFFLASDSVVDGYLDTAMSIGGRIDDMIASGEGLDIGEVAKLKEWLFDLVQLIRPMKKMMHEILRWQIGARFRQAPALEGYHRHLSDHLGGVFEEIYIYRDVLSGALQDYEARQTDELNKVVTRLTVATIVLSSWSLVAGIYGMNVSGLFPSSQTAHGASWVLAVCTVIGGLEIWLFKRKGLLSILRRSSKERVVIEAKGSDAE